jgi:hypothetical protein
MRNLTCVKLIHGRRSGKAAWHKAIWEKKFVGLEAFRVRCDWPTEGLKVSGASFTAFAEPCKTHKKRSHTRGSELKVEG